MAVLESDVRDLFKTIMSDTMKTVSAGRKTVIAPTVVRQLAKEITAEAEQGTIAAFESALSKAEKIVNQLGFNVKDFNKGLGDRIEELKEQKIKADKEVTDLRAKNIVAETRTIREGKEYRIEANILTNKEIKDRQRILQKQEKLYIKDEKNVKKEREKLLKKETLTNKEKEFIIREEARLQELRNNLDNENEVLNPDGESPLEAREGMRLPPALQGLLDAFMSPFMAIGEAFTTFKDQITSVGEVFAFGFKGLGKGFKGLISGIKFLGAFFMTGKVLIGVAIAGLVVGLIKFRDKLKGVKDFLMGIPKTIGDFFKEQFTNIKNFLIDVINGIISIVNKVLPKRREIPLIQKEIVEEKTGAEIGEDLDALLQKKEIESEKLGPSGDEASMISNLRGANQVKITGNNQVGDVLGSLSYQPFDMANLGKSQEERMIDANTIKEQELQDKSKSNIPFLQNNNNQTNISGSSSTTVGMSSGTSNGDATFDNMAGAVSP